MVRCEPKPSLEPRTVNRRGSFEARALPSHLRMRMFRAPLPLAGRVAAAGWGSCDNPRCAPINPHPRPLPSRGRGARQSTASSTGSFPRKRQSLFGLARCSRETEIPAFAGMTPGWGEASRPSRRTNPTSFRRKPESSAQAVDQTQHCRSIAGPEGLVTAAHLMHWIPAFAGMTPWGEWGSGWQLTPSW